LISAGFGVAIAQTPVGSWFSFIQLPLWYYGMLAGVIGVYLLAVEGAKKWFYGKQRGNG
jgi:Mg2+-importing ATPase